MNTDPPSDVYLAFEAIFEAYLAQSAMLQAFSELRGDDPDLGGPARLS